MNIMENETARDKSMPAYYDRQGKAINLEDFGKFHQDKDYVVVRQHRFFSTLFSTVWLGINHNFGDGAKPIIFESMSFKINESGETDPSGYDYQDRYDSEWKAVLGHYVMMAIIILRKMGGEDKEIRFGHKDD